MPELPEVETVVRDLRPLVTGRTIVGVRHSDKKLRRPWKPAWNARVTGATVTGVRRRGKWILVDLLGRAGSVSDRSREKHTPPVAVAPGSPGPVLRVHLGMTGQFTVVPAATPEPDHLHLAFTFDNGTVLRLRDPRRFGSAEFFADRAALDAEMNAELGPEPFGLDAAAFREAVTWTSRNLKAVLLDQTIVAGVGNIYADEALFRSKLHPARAGKSLTPDECDRLRLAVEAVLSKAIESRGSTIRDYVGGSGLRGGFQNEHAVYGRTGEPCPTCKGAVACERLAGRSSHFCGACQPAEGQAKPTARTRASPRGS